ncbi:MAG: response regulator [Myxococcota bacterium]|nr:response regulator [Myxococcota bacterium]
MTDRLEVDRVLILDDEEPLLRLLARLVVKVGGTPVLATTCAEARELLAENAFACVLLDKNLPDGNGLDLLPQLKESRSHPDVLVLTAHAEMSSAIFALRCGAADYLVKPFSTTLVLHRLEQIFDKRRLLEERTRLQAQLMRADRMAALGTLAAGVAHEIKNPLSFMSLGLDALETELPRLRALAAQLRTSALAGLAEELESALAAFDKRLQPVRTGVDRMARLAGDLKDYARGGHEDPAEVDLRGVVKTVVAMARGQLERKAQLVVELDEVPPVMAVASRLEQVLLNLTVNAFQALDDRGENQIRITTRTDPEGDAVLEVRDTGRGIPGAVLHRIFEPFFTTKPAGEGTGLGLSISHEIVSALGGAMEVESVASQGALFRVRLPRLGRSSVSGIKVPADEPAAPRTRILVVDDEPTVARMLQDALGAEHDVVSLTTARTALQQLTVGAQYDVIVCDLMMPEMTGMDLHQELQRVAPAMAKRMLFLTGAADARNVRAFLNRVDNVYLEKPFHLEELRQRIADLMSPVPTLN